MFKLSVALVALAASMVSAHGGVSSYIIDGKEWPGWEPYNPNAAVNKNTIQRPWPSYDPIMSPDGVNIRCNNRGESASAPEPAPIRAGGEITAIWKQWTHAEGPVTVYLAKCPGSCKNWDGSGKVWFKIDEAGLLSGTINKGEWGNGIVLKTLRWTSTIPASIAPGDYLIRHEVLALHQAMTPQFYPECAEIRITGGGSAQPSGDYLTSFPGAFKMGDPGVSVQINTDTSTTYIVPGPRVWNPDGSGSGPVAPPPTTPTTPPPTNPAPTTPAPQPNTPKAEKWGQCGGIGWNGATECNASTCRKINDYYSQCQ